MQPYGGVVLHDRATRYLSHLDDESGTAGDVVRGVAGVTRKGRA
jgi:hypothetical protein